MSILFILIIFQIVLFTTFYMKIVADIHFIKEELKKRETTLRSVITDPSDPD